MKPPAPPQGAGHRRALSNLGGAAERSGDPALADPIAEAFELAVDPEAGRLHIHGFHSYPARLHPTLARRLIEALCPPGGTVLDPFCGSGTVLVEARLAGRRPTGVDLNPLAARLASLKAQGRSAAHLEALVARARDVAVGADARRKAKAGPSRRYGPEDLEAFPRHVLLELDGLRVGIRESAELVRLDLELVLSSLLTKLSLKAGDSAKYQVEKRIAAGYPARLFVARTEELARQMTEYQAALPAGAPPARALEGDTRALPSVGSFDLILTSPPYPGNYDYLQHHELRLRWLGLDARAFAAGEVGARRHLEASDQARGRWREELRSILEELRRRLAPGGRAVFVLADSVVRGGAFYNDDLLKEAAADAGFRVLAQVSQPRPHFHEPTARAFEERPRREHVICVAADPTWEPRRARPAWSDAAPRRAPTPRDQGTNPDRSAASGNHPTRRAPAPPNQGTTHASPVDRGRPPGRGRRGPRT